MKKKSNLAYSFTAIIFVFVIVVAVIWINKSLFVHDEALELSDTNKGAKHNVITRNGVTAIAAKSSDEPLDNLIDGKLANNEGDALPTSNDEHSNSVNPENGNESNQDSSTTVPSSAKSLNSDIDGNVGSAILANSNESSETAPDIVQSPARPLGLDIIDIVKAGGEDDASRDFLENGLPEIETFLDDIFEDRKNIETESRNLTLEDLILQEDSDVRVYFVKEGTIFHNSFGVEMGGEAQLIFPDASSIRSYFRDKDTRATKTSEDTPILPGDFVDLGPIEKGTALDFFLIKDGARDENGKTYWTHDEDDKAQFNHVKLHGVYNENTLIIGFEDIPGGGDKDFNDLVVAVEIKSP